MTGEEQHRDLSLEDFVLLLNRREPSDLTQEQLMASVARLRLSDELVAAHARFTPGDYTRNLVLRTAVFELLVLCWRPDQHTTIHDHDGSLNAIRVHSGELTSRLYLAASGTPPRATGPVRMSHEHRVRRGAMTGAGRDGIHQLANTGTEDLITIHVYTPPLMRLTVYAEDRPDTQVRPLRSTLREDLA